MNIGIGTYSFGGIASFLGLGPTLLEKLQKGKELGFDSVELLAIDLENDARDISAWLRETGMTVTSVHAQPSLDVVKKLAAIGGQAVIWPGTPFCDKAEAVEVARQLDEMADMAAPFGVKVGYHNHSQEFYFDQGKSLLEHLMDNSEKCFAQLDCGWAMNGGMYPPYFIRKYRNRVISIHVKENCRVAGPGEKPVSRHAPGGDNGFFEKVKQMPLEERKKVLAGFLDREHAQGSRFNTQCPMGAEESNINWHEVKRALDEQDFAAFWIVEREGFYDTPDICIAQDCAWLKANIR